MSNLTPRSLAAPEGLHRDYLLHHRVCPKGYVADDNALVIAAAPGARLDDCLDDLSALYAARINVEDTPLAEVEAMIERLFTDSARAIELSRSDDGGAVDHDDATADVRD